MLFVVRRAGFTAHGATQTAQLTTQMKTIIKQIGILMALLAVIFLADYGLERWKQACKPADITVVETPLAIATSTKKIVPKVKTIEGKMTAYLQGVVSVITPEAVIEATNEVRTIDGLPALTLNGKLAKVARRRADDMVAKDYYSHRDASGTLMMSVEAVAVGYEYAYLAENLACGSFKDGKCLFLNASAYKNTGDLMLAWMASPSHRSNVLHQGVKEIGVYVGQNLIVVVFGSVPVNN